MATLRLQVADDDARKVIRWQGNEWRITVEGDGPWASDSIRVQHVLDWEPDPDPEPEPVKWTYDGPIARAIWPERSSNG